MRQLGILIWLVTVTWAVQAQDWVEHGGAEYNCDVLRGILADYGDRDLSRQGERVATVGELFAVFFPTCPEAADTATSVTPSQTNASVPEARFSFSSEVAGLQPVLGPISLPTGVYVFTATADAGMSVSPTIVSGNCGLDLELGSIVFFTSNGTTQVEQSAVEVEEDCNVLLEIGNYGSESWSLTIHKVESIEPVPQTAYAFESSELGLQPVVGPLRLVEGVYLVTATSDAGMSVTPTVLSGECGLDLELGSIIFFTSDNGTQVEQSAVEVESDCQFLLEVKNFGGSLWSVAIEKLS